MSHRPHRTVDRIASILEQVTRFDNEGLSVAELAAHLGAPKSSIQELVYGLEHAGYLVEHRHRFTLGPAAYVLTLAAEEPFWNVPRDALDRLHDRTGVRAVLAVRCGDSAVYVGESMGAGNATFHAVQRLRRPLLTTAAGKAILSVLDNSDLQRFFRSRPPEDLEHINRFLDELPEIRERGYTTNMGVSIPGNNGIAAPIGRSRGNVPVVVGLSYQASRGLDPDELGAILIDEIRSWSEQD